MATKRTPAEIIDLQLGWTSDPCWDIEDTPGFEAHREELQSFRVRKEAQWESEHQARLENKAAELGVPGNLALAIYVLNLENQLTAMQERLDLIEARS